MWYCIDCEKEFESPGCIGDLVGITCPFCSSTTIVDCLDFFQPETDKLIPEFIEEQIADMYATMEDLKPPEHLNCSCINEFNIPEYLTNFDQTKMLRCTHCHDDFINRKEFEKCPRCGLGNLISEEIPQLSFDDLEINEQLLIGLPTERDRVVSITYLTEMNERFLHTFIDDCFVS